ncbi:MAG: hypothetical protein Q9186_006812 [Xanthomendoza sp. 1 TL-2023]
MMRGDAESGLRRFASEEAQTQSEPVADGAEAQHGDNSIAASSSADSETKASRAAKDSQPHEDQRQEQSTIGEFASSASGMVRETASNAYDAVTGGSGASSRGMDSGSSLGPKPDVPESSSVYVGNLFFDVRVEDLRTKFEEAGTIESIKIVMDNRGLSKGFGYVNFTSIEAATNAIHSFNMQPFEGRRLSVQYAAQRTPILRRPTGGETNPPSRTLFIGNMSFDMSDRELNDLFREIRNVVDVRVAIDRRTGQPRGFAHADFTDMESAKEALVVLSGKEVCGRNLRVDYSSSSTGRAKEMRNTEGQAAEERQKGY